MRSLFVLLVMLAMPGAAVGAEAHRRVLTLRIAERAIDLAWQAELGGDHAGARKALEALVRTATASEEIAARARVDEWLGTLATRESLAKQLGRSPRFYSGAHTTLRSFGIARSSQLWSRALADVAGLRAATSSTAVMLQADRAIGPLDGAAALRLVAGVLEAHALRVTRERARFEVRLDLESSTAEKLERGFRAVGFASLKIRERGPDGKKRLVGNVDKRRVEARPIELEAQRFAARRATDDAADGLVFHIRARLLEEVALRSNDPGVNAADKDPGAQL